MGYTLIIKKLPNLNDQTLIIGKLESKSSSLYPKRGTYI